MFVIVDEELPNVLNSAVSDVSSSGTLSPLKGGITASLFMW